MFNDNTLREREREREREMHESHKVQVYVKSFTSSRQKQPFAQFVTEEGKTLD